MKELTFALIFSAFAFGSEQDVTIYIDENYSPFSYKTNGQAVGLYADILNTAFSRMKSFNVKLVPIPWKRGKKIMEQGKGFGLTPAYFHGHDWPYLYPYSFPFYTETVITICQSSVLEKPKNNWPYDYLGLKIGNVAGYDGWGGTVFRQLVAQRKIKYEETKGVRDSVIQLIVRNFDCIIMEGRAFDYVYGGLKDHKYGTTLLKKGAVVGKDSVYIGYSKPAIEGGKYPYYMKFMQAFDSAIYKMRKSGEIKKIMSRSNHLVNKK
ncbi:substrate-binding periplasmic protein [Spartinivicinus poritis]|uniref:Solute-binding protein family 3/N-terminal domain-containing protein n=1 Tax=Spartinivicinus poritis TaxID=2994640 RepID=A0ABT5UFY4_9GAMM|nr:hypothetical protein [Spartinivicinus sp. A2-2]MDE1465105.1 hypothetical protein [Spartinivicinus sp. A2-2]